MNVLLVSDYISEYGGGEVALINIKNILEKRGHKVFLLGEKTNKESLRSFFERWFSLKYYFKTRKIIKEKKIDIVHINGCALIVSPSPIIAAKKLNKRTIMMLHSFGYYCPKIWSVNKEYKFCSKGYHLACLFSDCPTWKSMKTKPFFLTVKWLKIGLHRYLIKKYVDYFISPSRQLKESIRRTFNLSEKKITHLPNFIEIPENHKIDFSRIKNNQFLFVGRISEEKGISVAIKAIDDLVKKDGLVDIKLKIIGDGNEMNNLKKLVKKLDIEDNIKFLGKIDNNKLNRYYQESVAILMPSVWIENNPLVALEAMKNCKPIIASNIGGYVELIDHGKNGYLFNIGNHKEMSTYIKSFIKMSHLASNLERTDLRKLKKNLVKKNITTI